MHGETKKILLISMPFAGNSIPAIQLPILESYLKDRDISVNSRHLYLKAAEFYGINNYNFLINSPNDSYSAQMIFSKYVFPDYWEKENKCFYDRFNIFKQENDNFLSFKEYESKTDFFFNWVIENVDWINHDIIGFTINYGQFLPSLAVAKKIKEMDSNKKIIFGGSRTTGDLGKNTLKVFDYVDFICSGDGEELLYLLASDYENFSSIPHLIYRKNNEIIWNKSDHVVDLNTSSIPNFDMFFNELSHCSAEIQQYFTYYGRLPVEITRGCWWNKCSFCNLNIQHSKYREKNVENIVREIDFLSEKYKILNFHLIGNILPKNSYKQLFIEIIKLDKDLNFFVEDRAGQLKSDDYTLMKEAGFINIQTGIESLSRSYLNKMNKGVRVIDNIATLKFCRENSITNEYNLIVNYPNEDFIDYEETKRNIDFLKQYIDPPQINNLLVGIGSPIYDNPTLYNINRFDYSSIDKIMFPKEVLENGLSFYYDFKCEKPINENNWEELISNWIEEKNKMLKCSMKSHLIIDKFIYYFVDGKDFLKIFDKRDSNNVRIMVIDDLEREVFLFCLDVRSLDDLKERFSDVPEFQLVAILRTFEKAGLFYIEDENYLSLPLNYKKCLGIKHDASDDNLIERIVKEKPLGF